MGHFFEGVTTIEELKRRHTEVMQQVSSEYKAKVEEIRVNAPQYKPVKIVTHSEVFTEPIPELILLQRSGANVNSPILTIDLAAGSVNY